MGGKFSRDKGQRAEREVAAIINDLTGWNVRRRVRQHAGDSDLEGVDGWSIEIKSHATLSVPAWWRQAVEQAGDNHLPVLFYKIPRKGWRALWPLSSVVNHDEQAWNDLEYTCDTTIEAWATVARDMVEAMQEFSIEDKAEAQQAGESVH